jgi:2-polyprenyl-3-methyl-5-hydroxy-6-metoxy-1,4-benzoquinol methylase
VHSALCTERQLTSDVFVAWAERIRAAWDHEHSGVPVGTHRKIWEWLFIIEALRERDMLRPGRRGLGFGVGRDPLAALFASLGCDIVATDLDPERAAAEGWIETGQHGGDRMELNSAQLCDPEVFEERVSFRVVDMTAIPDDLREFDFVWSSCALEHLGSLARGQAFVRNAMDCVRPSGVAVHTTEYNVSSNRRTVIDGPTVLYRRKDIEQLVHDLRRRGNDVAPVDFDSGDQPADLHVDVPPWSGTHLKLRIEGYAATSLALIVEKRDRSARAAAPVALIEARDRAEQGWYRLRSRLRSRSSNEGTTSPGRSSFWSPSLS